MRYLANNKIYLHKITQILSLVLTLVIICSPIKINAKTNSNSSRNTNEVNFSETVRPDYNTNTDSKENKTISFFADFSKVERFNLKSDISIILSSTDYLYNFVVTLSADNNFKLTTKNIPATEYTIDEIIFDDTNENIYNGYVVYYESNNIDFSSNIDEMKIIVEKENISTSINENTEVIQSEPENLNKDINNIDNSNNELGNEVDENLSSEIENIINKEESVEPPEVNEEVKNNTTNNVNNNKSVLDKKFAGGILITIIIIISVLGLFIYKIKKNNRY